MSALHGMEMHGQRVLVVGVGGIGAPCAEICAELGAGLVLADREEPTGLAWKIRDKYSVPTEAHRFDVADIRGVVHFCDLVGSIDALIITAGFLPKERDLAPGTDDWDQSFSDVFNVNVRGPMLLAQLFLKEMISKSSGRIVILGSIAGRSGGLLSGAQYAASKGALHALVRWLALRAAPHGVTVNGVAPGATATRMLATETVDVRKIPSGRLAEPVEVARVVSFLASPAASYMHGAIVDVNGGAVFS